MAADRSPWRQLRAARTVRAGVHLTTDRTHAPPVTAHRPAAAAAAAVTQGHHVWPSDGVGVEPDGDDGDGAESLHIVQTGPIERAEVKRRTAETKTTTTRRDSMEYFILDLAVSKMKSCDFTKKK